MATIYGQNARERSILDDNYIYISHLDEDFRFWILPTTPDQISDNMQSNFATTTALGRSAPVLTYSNSGPRTVTVSLKLHRDLMEDANYKVSNTKLAVGDDYVDNLIKALQSISLPNYDYTNKVIEPPMVALRLGKQVFIKGVVNSSIGITYNKPIQSDGKWAVVDLTLSITEVDPYDAKTVFEQGSYRGMVGTLREGAKKYLSISED